MTIVTIGQRIRAVRESRKITQKDLAATLEMNQPQLSDWERGRYTPDRDNLIRVAKALKLPVEYFTDEPDSLTTPDTAKGVTYAPLQQEGGVDVALQAEARIRELETECSQLRAALVRVDSAAGGIQSDIDRALGRSRSKETRDGKARRRANGRGHHPRPTS